MRSCLENFVCPVCRKPLKSDGQSIKCENRHSFDIASEGYVNLLIKGRPGSGDSKAMIAARHDFLQKAYYSCFREAMTELISDILKKDDITSPFVFDAGCGEGYYTAGITDELIRRGYKVRAAGVDISTPAVKRAAKRSENTAFAVSSIFDLPVGDSSADIMLSVFAPISEAEFKRVIKRGGSLIIAAPGRRHLFGLKEVLYDSPYENDENQFDFEGFTNGEVNCVNNRITLDHSQDILNLFAMTPYYWKTPPDGSKRLGGITGLATEIEFEFHVFKRL